MNSLNSLDELKNHIIKQTNLEELIKDDTEIRKHGTRLVACCPFHEENTPSFYIFADHYHCFGCKAHGDAINYVREKKGLAFIEALEYLGQRAGINCDSLRQNKGQKKIWQKKRRETQAFTLAQEFFLSHLKGKEGQEAYEYIRKRHYSPEEIKTYGFGYAPSSPQRLSNFLLSKGFSKEELEDFSLANNHSGRPYDFFRHRLMIPIRDIHGKLIAFGGRSLSNENYQKYKNSRYDKRQVLFGMDHAYKAMKKKGRVIIVEGYLDAIRLWSQGIDEAVACQGTTLTKEHIDLLKPLTKQVYLLFDGDQAGQSSALSLVENTLGVAELSFYFAKLPKGEDPDSYTLKNGAEQLNKLLSHSTPLTEFVIRDHFEKVPEQNVPSLLREKLLPWVGQIQDPLEKAYLLKKMAEISGIDEKILNDQVKKAKRIKSFAAKNEPEAAISYEQKIPPYLLDLLGHLYFMDPKENVDLQPITKLRMEINLVEPWSAFLEELLACLTEEKISPCEKPVYSWLASYSTVIKEFIANIRRDQMAFTCSNRAQQLEKVLSTHEKFALKRKISTLKSKVLGQNNSNDEEYNSRILLEIHGLYKKLALLNSKTY